MNTGSSRLDWNRGVALIVALALHAAVLYGLWTTRVMPQPPDAATLFVTLINPPSVTSPTPRPAASVQARPVEPRPVRPTGQQPSRPIAPPSAILATQAPAISPVEPTAPLPGAEPEAVSSEPGAPGPLHSSPLAVEPVNLTSDLALSCPVRTPPPYPTLSRRLGETGKVVLRVELDEAGRVSAAQVITSSGYHRLDAAALAAVKAWRCQPAQRGGQAVRSVALQPFDFTLEGH
jgi:protein TonB